MMIIRINLKLARTVLPTAFIGHFWQLQFYIQLFTYQEVARILLKFPAIVDLPNSK